MKDLGKLSIESIKEALAALLALAERTKEQEREIERLKALLSDKGIEF